MLGTWKGYYQHESQSIPEGRRLQRTNFTMNIDIEHNNQFSGSIKDDTKTSGMEGTGIVNGEMNGSNISFIKQMPHETILLPDGQLKTTKRKHPPIYYQGTLNLQKGVIEGTWRFKFGFTWFGIIPMPILPIKVKWQAIKLEN